MTTTELISVLRKMQVLGPVSQGWVEEAADRLEVLDSALTVARDTIAGLQQAARIERTRQEPSRLEIAAMFFHGMRASGYIWGDPEKVALDDADKLIAAAKK